jgi:Zn-dependent peptidase ImmA (M78 family)
MGEISMFSDYVKKLTKNTIRRFDTRNPFEISRGLGIEILYRNDFTELKGMYTVIKRKRFIFLNANLPEQMLTVVCAHELGHDALHRKIAASMAFQEFALYDMKNRYEYEANTYAAHLLLDDIEIEKLAKDGYDVVQIAQEMNTDINLMLIKMHEMNKEKNQFNIPYIPRSDFLGR